MFFPVEGLIQPGMWDFCAEPSLPRWFILWGWWEWARGWGISLMFLFVIDSALSLSSPRWNLSLGVSWGNMFFLSLAALFCLSNLCPHTLPLWRQPSHVPPIPSTPLSLYCSLSSEMYYFSSSILIFLQQR